jgi:alpha-beta hydrolase superfamily lysophospholipase
MIFFPEKLNKNYKFNFDQPFEEVYITTKDQKSLHGLLFKSDYTKGLIFYLHGNAGSVNSWGEVAKTYTDLNYDVFIIDYRGFGKSEGSITSEPQFFEDVQIAYEEMKSRYVEDKIVVLGYSVGTGPAAKLASTNNPRMLILKAPYYSLVDMMRHTYPVIPTFILKYEFRTNEYLKNCKMPVVMFHGTLDEVIYYNSSVKLKKMIKQTDTLITLDDQSHNGITDNLQYKAEIARILAQ